jgi:hypothetical protein
VTESKQWLLVLLFLLFLEVSESLIVRKDATQIYPPKIGWRLVYFLIIADLLYDLIGYAPGMQSTSKGFPLWFCVPFLLALLVIRPRTIASESNGLASYSLYGLRHSFIPWSQVSSVTSDWQEEGNIWWGWFARGYSVVVTGRDGTRIENTLYLSRQGKFLDDLRQHVPAVAFAPGLFDWHP